MADRYDSPSIKLYLQLLGSASKFPWRLGREHGDGRTLKKVEEGKNKVNTNVFQLRSTSSLKQ